MGKLEKDQIDDNSDGKIEPGNFLMLHKGKDSNRLASNRVFRLPTLTTEDLRNHDMEF